MAEQDLSDVKVLDLTWYMAGPYCTKLLGDCGAEVIKVERPGAGDPARSMGPFFKDDPHPEKSGLFLHLNTNKKSITVNLKSETGKQILKEMVKDVDILVENFRPRVMSSLGLSYDELKKINPRLVMTSISNFGQTGPYRDYQATEIVAQAMGGFMYVTGAADREPLKIGGSQAQYIAGASAFLATLCALYGQEQMGFGQHLDVSIMECLMSGSEHNDLYYSGFGAIQGRKYYRYSLGYIVEVYMAKDGYILLGASGMAGTGMPKIPVLVDRPDLIDHPYFRADDPRPRIAASDEEFDTLLNPYFRTHTKMEIAQKAQELRMATGPVQTTQELLNCPQLKARDYFKEIEHPMVGKLAYPGMPFITSEASFRWGRAPLLGEHNEEVYGPLGYTRDDLVKLRERGII